MILLFMTKSYRRSFISNNCLIILGESELDPSNDRYTLLDRGQILEINSAEVSDTSKYYCTVINIAGEDKKEFNVFVQGFYKQKYKILNQCINKLYPIKFFMFNSQS